MVSRSCTSLEQSGPPYRCCWLLLLRHGPAHAHRQTYSCCRRTHLLPISVDGSAVLLDAVQHRSASAGVADAWVKSRSIRGWEQLQVLLQLLRSWL